MALARAERARADLARHEQPVAAMLDRVIAAAGGWVALGRLGSALGADAGANRAAYEAFKDAARREFKASGWTDTSARSWLGRAGLVAAGVIALVTAVLVALVAPALGANRVLIALAGLVALVALTVILLIGAFGVVSPRYTPAGIVPALRWRAYRAGLAAGRPPEVAMADAAEFDHQLVYAVALGLEGPVIAAGWALGDRHPVRGSALLWYGAGWGHGGSASNFGTLSSELGSSLAPPASSGGGFSGGGISGGASGGGGGGAW